MTLAVGVAERVAQAWSIARRIADRVQQGPERPALTVDGETLSYAELWSLAAGVAATLPDAGEPGLAPVTALMAHRHLSSYVAVLACLLRGHTYVPINVEHPQERNLKVLRKSGARQVICGAEAAAAWSAIHAAAPELNVTVLDCPDRKPAAIDVMEPDDTEPAPFIAAERRAYILFTSGSTGEPKGVPISHGALTGYLDAASKLMPTGPDDRFSQTFELTFDLSIHDLLLCWTSGAHLVVAGRTDLARPATYIRSHGITRWFSVPSLAYQVRLQGDLDRGAFPSLRTSLFCGEALPSQLAAEWAAAAPNSAVENWYGPTEATIACARYVVPAVSPGATPEHDVVPIGDAFEGMSLSIHAEDGSPLPDGAPGELWLAGRQLSEGYLDDPERNARVFVRLPNDQCVFYRTGDRAVRDPGGPVRFLGRVDNQVKVRGFRVELGEIEAVLRRCTNGANAVALSWPPDQPSGHFVVAAIETAACDVAQLLDAAAKSLPDYMVPAQVVCLRAFPTGASGKADRKAIAQQVQAALSAAAANADLSGLSPPARRLMQAVLAVAPTMDPARILASESVMAAGMDSLSFISLTAEIERLYGRTLDEEEVVQLSLSSFAAMVDHLEGLAGPATSAAAPAGGKRRGGWRAALARFFGVSAAPTGVERRTNRALQFVQRFPAALAAARTPVVLALGSSGTFRALDPDAFEDEARRLGHPLTVFNIGLAGIGLPGLVRMAEWIARTCESAHVRPELVLWELDPPQVSTLPRRNEATLDEACFNGTLQPYPQGRLAPEFDWSAEAHGAWQVDAGAARNAKRHANWERERDMEVARIFMGGVEFVPTEVERWVTGLRSLQRVAQRTVVFVHPANATMTSQLPAQMQGDRFVRLLRRIQSLPGVELVAPDAFDLADADFLDINHVNPMAGRPKLSRQLARLLLGR